MTPRSLRLRLLLGAGAWVTLALVAAGFAIVLIFTTRMERDRYEDLLASLDRVLTAVSAEVALPEVAPALNDPRYGAPAGGLYWQVLDVASGETARSRSLWDTVLTIAPPPPASTPALGTTIGPSGQLLDTLTQDVALAGDGAARRLRVSVAEDAAIRGRDIRDFAIDIAVALAALAAALILAGWLTVHLGLKPLLAVRRELEDVTGGRAAKLSETYPLEVVPLINEVNALLSAHERSIASARSRADDLAHGLKTPLAVLSATAARLRGKGDTENAGVLEILGEEMALRVDYQMRVAQLRVRTGDHALSASLDEALLRSVAVLRRTVRGEELFWKLDTENITVDMDPHDLMELIGVLLENAAKWARTEVRVTCRGAGERAEFELADDGPGLTDAEIATLGQRGKRLDETRSGTGFGIAIAREILNLNNGTLAISRAETGGLRVLVSIPAAQIQ